MKRLFLALSFAACASTAVFAQDQTPAPQGGMQGGGMQGGGMHGQFMQACGADMQTYCASAQSRDDRRACVTANKDKFSDSCKSFMAAHPMREKTPAPGGQ
jgi:Spy/CpxP family protein refolding chaperone